MVAILGSVFFLAVLAVAVWSVVDAALPRLDRIVALFEQGAALDAAPPVARRATRRGAVPARVPTPVRHRAAA